MCCLFTSLVLFGPRFAGAIWWLVNPVLWNRAFNGAWLWPLLGLIFLPWTTLMYILVFPAGIVGLDWLWMGLAVLADIAWYSGAAARRRVPGYTGTY